jgi:hypothetical protein
MSLEVQSERVGGIGVAVVATPGTINIMHCLKVLGDLAGVHIFIIRKQRGHLRGQAIRRSGWLYLEILRRPKQCW